MRPRIRTRNNAGLTLAEAVVASLIVAFLLVTLLTSFVMGRFTTQVAKHRAQAMNAVRARLEYLKGLGYETLNAMYPVTVEYYVPIDTVRNGAAMLTGTRTTTITDTDADDVLELHVQIQWQERHWGQTTTVTEELQTLLAPPE